MSFEAEVAVHGQAELHLVGGGRIYGTVAAAGGGSITVKPWGRPDFVRVSVKSLRLAQVAVVSSERAREAARRQRAELPGLASGVVELVGAPAEPRCPDALPRPDDEEGEEAPDVAVPDDVAAFFDE